MLPLQPLARSSALPLPMIRFTPNNLKRPINLLHENKSNQLMREGNLSEGEFGVGAPEDILREAETAANNEGHLATAVGGELIEVCCELLRSPWFPVDSHRNDIGVRLDLREDALAFLLLDGCF